MNLRNLQLLLEAVAFTVCLIYIAGQQAEAKTLTSEVAINTLHRSLGGGITLTAEPKLPIVPEKVNSNIGDIWKNCTQRWDNTDINTSRVNWLLLRGIDRLHTNETIIG